MESECAALDSDEARRRHNLEWYCQFRRGEIEQDYRAAVAKAEKAAKVYLLLFPQARFKVNPTHVFRTVWVTRQKNRKLARTYSLS